MQNIIANYQTEKPNALAPDVSDYAIARQWGCSRTRVFQLRLRALKKLRAAILADPVLRQLAIDCGCELEA